MRHLRMPADLLGAGHGPPVFPAVLISEVRRPVPAPVRSADSIMEVRRRRSPPVEGRASAEPPTAAEASMAEEVPTAEEVTGDRAAGVVFESTEGR